LQLQENAEDLTTSMIIENDTNIKKPLTKKQKKFRKLQRKAEKAAAVEEHVEPISNTCQNKKDMKVKKSKKSRLKNVEASSDSPSA